MSVAGLMIKEHISLETKKKTKQHPCYSKDAHQYARMHVPVAPKCNVQCNYCNRKYDCQNESRPGVTSSVLSPQEALGVFRNISQEMDKLSVVGIAGPGDALANFSETKETIELIKETSPETVFCLSTNGLGLPQYMEEIVSLGVSHVTITINAVDPKVASKIYKHIFYKGKKYIGIEAGEVMVRNQLEGLEYLAKQDILVKVNIVYIKGVNDRHIDKVVEVVKQKGACMTNIMPLIPVEGTAFEKLEKVSPEEIDVVRKRNEKNITQMYHCRQCRADAIGQLGKDCGCSRHAKQNIS